MNISKTESVRRTHPDYIESSSSPSQTEQNKEKQPTLISRPKKTLAYDVTTELKGCRTDYLEKSESEKYSESVTVRISNESSYSDESDAADISGEMQAEAKSAAAAPHPADMYCSEPMVCTRFTATVLFASSVTALSVLIVKTTIGDAEIAQQALGIGIGAMTGLAISGAAGLLHYAYTVHSQQPAGLAQPA